MRSTNLSGFITPATRTALLIAILFAALHTTYAQIPSTGSQMTGQQQDKMFQVQDFQTGLSNNLENAFSVMDGPIDADYYTVGPGDVFYLAVWGSVPFAFTVPVTLEGEIIVPTLGTVNVANLSLTEAKHAVTEKLRGGYRYGTISVSLLQPRRFTVILKGAVLQPGQYTASSVDRVDRIVRRGAERAILQSTVNMPVTPQTTTRGQKYEVPVIEGIGQFIERASTRNIFVVHKNGDTSHADIPKYLATGDSKYNPYLRDGDVIYVPLKELEQNSISVHGSVNNPGTFEYVPGDRLEDAIHFSEGLRSDLTSNEAKILHRDGTSEQISLQSAQQYMLRKGDRIFIDPASGSQSNHFVELYGEVLSPGRYPITSGQSTLREIVSLSGGITERALPAGSAMFRKRDFLGDQAHPMLQLQEVIRAYPMVPSDSMFFLLNSQVGIDPVNIDMQAALLGTDPEADTPLQDGDIIFIARDRKSVLVQGQVRFPGYIPVKPGENYEYYIRKAGGFTEYADEGGTRLVKRATQSWLEPEDELIASGDILWVPKDPVRDFAYYLSVVKDIGLLAGSLVTIGLIIVQIEQLSKR